MDNNEPTPGLGHLLANALPLIGRVGAAVGGILGMLAALRAFTNEIATAVEGLVLVSAAVASAIVVWSRSIRNVEDTRVSVPIYSRRNRAVAGVALGVSALLLVALTFRVIANFVNQDISTRATISPTSVPLVAAAISPTLERPRTSGPNPTAGSSLQLASRTPVPSITPTPPPSFTSIPLTQLTDVQLLNKLGAEALAGKNYRTALGFFSRSLQVDATNPLSQLGFGETHFFLGNESAAQTALRMALQLDPKQVDAHAYLAYLYDQQQDYARARAEYDEFSRNAAKENPLLAAARDRLNQLTNRNPIPSATPLIVTIGTVTPAALASQTPTLPPTLAPTATLSPTLAPTLTLQPTLIFTPTRTSTPK
jgi:hypothetical protein